MFIACTNIICLWYSFCTCSLAVVPEEVQPVNEPKEDEAPSVSAVWGRLETTMRNTATFILRAVIPKWFPIRSIMVSVSRCCISTANTMFSVDGTVMAISRGVMGLWWHVFPRWQTRACQLKCHGFWLLHELPLTESCTSSLAFFLPHASVSETTPTLLTSYFSPFIQVSTLHM